MSDPQAITRGRTWDNPIIVSGDNGDWTFPQWDAPFGLIEHGTYTGYGHTAGEIFTAGGAGYWSTEGVSANHPYLELPSTQGAYTISSYSLLASPDHIDGGEVIDGVAYARVQPNAAYPAAWQLLGSNDGGTSWTVIDTRSGQDTGAFAPNPDEPTTMMAIPRTYHLSAPVTFTRFKFVVTAIPANANDTMTGSGPGSYSQPPIDRTYLAGLYFNETPWQEFVGQYHFHLTGLTPFARYDVQSVAEFCDGITLAVASHPGGVGSYAQARDLVSTLGIVTDELWVQMDFTTGTRHVAGEDFQMTGPGGVGSFTLHWGRSVDANGAALPAVPAGNYRWEVAQEIDVATPGSSSYDGNIDPAFRTSWGSMTRWWKFQAAQRGTVTFLTDEPDGSSRGYADWDGGAELYAGEPLRLDVELTHDGVDPSHSYYVEVQPLGLPGPASPYHLSWSFDPPPPVPYRIANDTPATATPVVIGQAAGSAGSFAYDNTGATADSTLGDKRSIWFSFSVPQTRYLTFTTTSTVFTGPDDEQPAITIWNADGVTPASGLYGSVVGPVLKAGGGATYLLEMSWPGAYIATPWDQGSVGWTVYPDIPNDSQTAPQVLPSPDQNLPITNPIPGYVGSQWFKIIIPADGGLCQVLEAAPGTDGMASGGSVYQVNPDGSLTLVATIPVRAPGDTTPALITAAKAGETYVVVVVASGPGVTLRTGLSHDVTWGAWHSADYSGYTSIGDGNGGDMAPSANMRAWPGDVATTAGSAGLHWSNYNLIPRSPASWPPVVDGGASMGQTIIAVAGGMNEPRPDAFNTAPSTLNGPVDGNSLGPSARWFGGQIFDPAKPSDLVVRTDTTYQMDVVGCVASVLGTTDPYFVAEGDWAKNARFNPYSLQNLYPVFLGGQNQASLLSSDPERRAMVRPWLTTNEAGRWFVEAGNSPENWSSSFGQSAGERFLRSLAVEWSPDNPTNKPRFDVFRAFSASWSKSVAGHGIGTPSYAPDAPIVSDLIIIPNIVPALGGQEPPLFMTPYISGDPIGDQPASFSSSGDYEGVYEPYGYSIAGSNGGMWLYEECSILKDVTNGAWPQVTVQHTEVYGCASNLPVSINYGEMSQRLFATDPLGGSIAGEGWCPGFDFEVSWGVAMQMGRKFPDQYRVGKYAESLAPIGASTGVPAGAILRAVGDLVAVPGEVAVHFATT